MPLADGSSIFVDAASRFPYHQHPYHVIHSGRDFMRIMLRRLAATLLAAFAITGSGCNNSSTPSPKVDNTPTDQPKEEKSPTFEGAKSGKIKIFSSLPRTGKCQGPNRHDRQRHQARAGRSEL